MLSPRKKLDNPTYSQQAKYRYKDFKQALGEHVQRLINIYNNSETNFLHGFVKSNLMKPNSALPLDSKTRAYTKTIYKEEAYLAKIHHQLVNKIIKNKLCLDFLHGFFTLETVHLIHFLDNLIETHFLIPHPELGYRNSNKKNEDEKRYTDRRYREKAKKALKIYLSELTLWRFIENSSKKDKFEIMHNLEIFQKSRQESDLDEAVKSAMTLCPILKAAYRDERQNLKRSLLCYFQFKKNHPSKPFPWFYISPCTNFGAMVKTHRSTYDHITFIQTEFKSPPSSPQQGTPISPVSSRSQTSPVRTKQFSPQRNIADEKKSVLNLPGNYEHPINELKISTLQLPNVHTPFEHVDRAILFNFFNDSQHRDEITSLLSHYIVFHSISSIILDYLTFIHKPDSPTPRLSSREFNIDAFTNDLPEIPSFWLAVTKDPLYWINALVALPMEFILTLLAKCNIPVLKEVIGGILILGDLISFMLTHGVSHFLQELGAAIAAILPCCNRNEVTKIVEMDEVGIEFNSPRLGQQSGQQPRMRRRRYIAPPSLTNPMPGVVVQSTQSDTSARRSLTINPSLPVINNPLPPDSTLSIVASLSSDGITPAINFQTSEPTLTSVPPIATDFTPLSVTDNARPRTLFAKLNVRAIETKEDVEKLVWMQNT